ncbi:MAG: Crp/Fnr family transcriptional regulator [Parasphingorhabdus sp.]|uniref:Crp/Fnr family transcriptional regulator n=1 Tax=Parasphingorhabdus sp. TaxID=2709688 RepID=UPI003002EB4B
MEQIPLFDELREPPDPLYVWHQRHVHQKILNLSSGQTVFHEGNISEYIFEVQSGTLKISKVTEDGRQLILGFPSIGDVIGLAGVSKYLHTAETVSAAKLRPISRRAIYRKLAENNALNLKLLDRLADQEMASQAHIALLTIAHTTSRIAAFVLNSVRKQSSDDRPSAFVHLPMTQRDIATYLAVAPETYSRTLRKFREAGILKSQNARRGRCGLEISNMARLQKIADGGNI